MLDKNGIEMKTGMIVQISGAYFKNDNGTYYIDRSPGGRRMEREGLFPEKNQQIRQNQHGKI